MSDYPRKVQRIIQQVSEHVRGMGCQCGAHDEGECGCFGTDWRSKREVAAVAALDFCLHTLKTYHTTKPGIAATIRETEAILRAGSSWVNAEVRHGAKDADLG